MFVFYSSYIDYADTITIALLLLDSLSINISSRRADMDNRNCPAKKKRRLAREINALLVGITECWALRGLLTRSVLS